MREFLAIRQMSMYVLAVLLLPFALGASPISDPGISPGESITYAVTIEKENFSVRQTTLVKKADGKKIYEIISSSPKEEQTIRIDAQAMLVVFSDILAKKPETVVHTVTTIVKNTAKGKDDEHVVINFYGLQHVLRGFPFEKMKSLKIRNPENTAFSLIVTMVEKAKIKLKSGKSYECYKLELGVEGFWGMFASKTMLWYAVESPHYLVRSEGPSGPPGSPLLVIELDEYAAGSGEETKNLAE